MKKVYIKSYLAFILFVCTLSNSYAHWTTKGPYGGEVTCFTVVDTIVYAGTADGGVYRTVNSFAAAWRYANYVGLTTGHINALTGIGRYVVAGTSDQGIFISKDLGASWTQYNNGITNLNIQSLTYGNGKVFAGTDGGGVFVSSDSGATWVAVNNNLGNLDVTTLTYDVSGVTIAGTNGGGLFVTIDDGLNWSDINTGLGNMNILSFAISGTTMVAGTASGVYSASTITPGWNVANTGLISTQVNNLHADGGVIFAATPSGVFSSPDNSISWTHLNNGIAPVNTNAVTSFNAELFAGTSADGIYSATPATTTWSPKNNGFNNLEGYSLYNSGNLVITATNKGLFVSRDLAATYTVSNNGLTDSLHVMCFAWTGSTLVAGTKNDGIFMSADTGATWTAVNNGLTDLNVRDIIFTSNYALAVTATGLVFQNPWTVNSWTQTGNGLPAGLDITALATDGSQSYLGTNGNGVYYSIDGINWNAMSNGLTNMNVTDLAVLNGDVYASTNGGGVFKCLFGLTSWSAINTGLTSMNILSLCASGSYVLAGYTGGVQATDNAGANWLTFGTLDYIPDFADVRAISFTSVSPRIFIATPNNSFYSNSIGELPAAISELDANDNLVLFPNPSNGDFSFRIKDASMKVKAVSLKDIHGKLVRDMKVTKDNHYKINDLKGMYLLEVITDKGMLVHKIMLQ